MLLRRSALVISATFMTIGCGNAAPRPDAPSGVRVDERAGSIRRVGLGSSRLSLTQVFGRAKDTTETGAAAEPQGADHDAIGAPNDYAFPEACQRAPAGPSPSFASQGLSTLSYPDMAFELCDDSAYEFITTAAAARTRRGVAIGQPLRAARRAYPQLHCGESTGDSTDPPTPAYPYCAGLVAPHRYLWFGQNPIRSIAVATVALHG
jgi:hypothetical protein